MWRVQLKIKFRSNIVHFSVLTVKFVSRLNQTPYYMFCSVFNEWHVHLFDI